MTRERVAAVILAAGASRRMGENKLLLRVGGQSLLRRTVLTAAMAGLDPVLVVLGHEADRTRAEVQDLPCTPVLNARHAEGPHTSLRAGFLALPDTARGAVVLLADMPRVTPAMLERLVALHRSGARLVVSDYEGVDAPPVLHDRTLFDELRTLEDPAGGKAVLARHAGDVVRASFPRHALLDLDVPADLAAVGASEARR
jgi:molybdenum cofactor cytidylyltransferase